MFVINMARNGRTGAQLLRAWLAKKGLTHPAFGELIGVTDTSVYLYLTERSTPSEATKLAIHKATRGAVPSQSWPIIDNRRQRRAANG